MKNSTIKKRVVGVILGVGMVVMNASLFAEGYLIITREEFKSTLQSFKTYKENQGLTVYIETYFGTSNDGIFDNYDGQDAQERIRNCIKDYYINHDVKWVLLAGDADHNDNPVHFSGCNEDDPDNWLDVVFDPEYSMDEVWEIPLRYVYASSAHGGGTCKYTPTDYFYAGLWVRLCKAGTGPMWVATADFNEDQYVDIVVANIWSGNVSVLLGNGDDTFQDPVQYTTGFGSNSVAVGDFDDDDDLDLAVTVFYNDKVAVLLGNGDGTFQTAVNYDVENGPHSVAVGDFDEDDDEDLVVANGYDDTVTVLLGDGDGTFDDTNTVDYGVGNDPEVVVVGDFDEDDDQDLAVSNHDSDNVSILLGNGNGTFQTAVNYGVGDGPVGLVIGDFNSDNDQDLAVSNANNDNISILIGDDEGTFQTAVSYDVGDCPHGVAVGDFNNDDDEDLAVANHYDDDISVLLGIGDGTFDDAVSYGAGNGAHAIAVANINIADKYDDTNQDLVVVNHLANTVLLLFGNGTGSFDRYWDDDADRLYGEGVSGGSSIDEADWTAEVYVGRFSAQSTTQMQAIRDKTINYAHPGIDNFIMVTTGEGTHISNDFRVQCDYLKTDLFNPSASNGVTTEFHHSTGSLDEDDMINSMN